MAETVSISSQIIDGIAAIEAKMMAEGVPHESLRVHFSPKTFARLCYETKIVGNPTILPQPNARSKFCDFPVVIDMADRDDDSISCCLMADGGRNG